MSKPIAVCISDVHYNINTLQLADSAMRQAISKANELGIPLIVAGDLHDTKANLRGECVNAMIETFKTYDIGVNCVGDEFEKRLPFILVGNHDKINEKSENHSLNFLSSYANIVEKVQFTNEVVCKGDSLWLVPYQYDTVELKNHLNRIKERNGRAIIMHQGLINSNSGHYIQDKSAITKEDVAGMRVISGHYHTRQDIELPDGGKWSYLGNPFTLNFGEANDPPKGYNVLMDDGSLEFIPTMLRKHVIIEHDLKTDESVWSSGPIHYGHGIVDLVWVKIKGTKEQLLVFDKNQWCKDKGIPTNIKLDLIPIDTTTDKTIQKENKTQPQVLDSLIDSLTETSDTRKLRLKYLWKEFNE